MSSLPSLQNPFHSKIESLFLKYLAFAWKCISFIHYEGHFLFRNSHTHTQFLWISDQRQSGHCTGHHGQYNKINGFLQVHNVHTLQSSHHASYWPTKQNYRHHLSTPPSTKQQDRARIEHWRLDTMKYCGFILSSHSYCVSHYYYILYSSSAITYPQTTVYTHPVQDKCVKVREMYVYIINDHRTEYI